ncbi:hypothetical protein [Pyxidicoccus xibeiensis]|uniref:hypothetical protein n=1 Tax=Pyxidicoccus xibeiensis TaxID=2906759 RepID=UPI0020A7364E|nr:hypothetical protein [Pyxidicoccus xibeiensis]MCP3139780.1 hypothetical protein [Pyxidicoccus xibeiensis]
MKAKILAGAVAALMYGSAAMAADGDCPPTRASTDKNAEGLMLAQAQDQVPAEEDLNQLEGDLQEDDSVIIETEPVPDATGASQDPLMNEGVGGSGQVGQDLGTGGSGTQGEVLLRCQPVQGQGTGGSGLMPQDISPPAPAPEPQSSAVPAYPQDDATGGSGIATPPPSDFQPSAERADPIEPLEVEEEEKNDTRGLTLLVGGGVEGYTGELAPQINPGATAGVRAALKPSKILGLELGYSGALNNIDAGGEGGTVDGPDLIRNGGQAVVTLGLFATDWHPYVLGGIGINDYNFRGGEALGYDDDTVGNVPAGVGFRGHVGDFTVDARANYNFLFDKEFAPGVDSGGGDFGEGGSYQGTVSVGGTF